MEKIAVGCDHAGYALKSELVGYLEELGYETLDLGTNSHDRVDYPDYGAAVRSSNNRGQSRFRRIGLWKWYRYRYCCK